MKYMKELYDIEIVSYRSSITFYGSKDYINGFIEKNFDGNVEDIETFKKSLINTAMLDSNRSFTEWLDKRTEYDWFTLNNGYKSKKQMNNNMKVPLSDLYKWDDILIELYDGDVCEAHFHRDCANAEDKNDSYYNGEKKDLFE